MCSLLAHRTDADIKIHKSSWWWNKPRIRWEFMKILWVGPPPIVGWLLVRNGRTLSVISLLMFWSLLCLGDCKGKCWKLIILVHGWKGLIVAIFPPFSNWPSSPIVRPSLEQVECARELVGRSLLLVKGAPPQFSNSWHKWATSSSILCTYTLYSNLHV